MELIKLDRPVIVEGKYDKIKLSSVIDTEIITTEGFRIFSDPERLLMLKKIAEKNGIIICTDSDGAGLVIRNYIKSAIPAERIINIYTPPTAGKEKRKLRPSKEGLLGVEGIDVKRLRELFLPFAVGNEHKSDERRITKRDLYEDGLSGSSDSVQLRLKLIRRLSLPENMSANALLEALNLLVSYDEYKECINDILAEKNVSEI